MSYKKEKKYSVDEIRKLADDVAKEMVSVEIDATAAFRDGVKAGTVGTLARLMLRVDK